MNSALTSVLLPAVLALIMFGLGMTMRLSDLLRIRQVWKAVVVALICQLVVLPGLCLGLVLWFELPAPLGIGMMLLAASPGGVSANLFSYLFRGDVALNITLTAINSIASVVSLPLIVNASFLLLMPQDASLGLQLDKVSQVFGVVLIPVFLGIAVNHRKPGLARRADRPMRIASTTLLATLAIAAIIIERDNLSNYLGAIGGLTALFCGLSLTVGYLLSRLARLGYRQAVAVSMEVGIHNSTLAIAIAISPTLLNNVELAIPAAVYAIVQTGVAGLFGLAVSRLRDHSVAEVVSVPESVAVGKVSSSGIWPASADSVKQVHKSTGPDDGEER